MVASKTEFTVRDLNRRPAEVLEACERMGGVLIRSRKGMTYELRLAQEAGSQEANAPTPAKAWEKIIERQRALREKFGLKPMTKAQWDRLSRMIAGE